MRRTRWLGLTLILALNGAPPAGAIVGPASEGAPYADEIVMVLTRGPQGSGFCSGVVIGPRAILTAAHCLRPAADMLVHFRDSAGAPVVMEVAATAAHPGYRADAQARRTRSIDVGLIATRADLPADFRPAPLAEGESPAPGERVVAAGYGVAQEGAPKTGGVLRAAELDVREPGSRVLLWLAPPQGEGGACSGDSGGPVLAGAAPTVVGVIAWTEGGKGRKCGALTQAVRIAPLRGWIEATLAGWRP